MEWNQAKFELAKWYTELNKRRDNKPKKKQQIIPGVTLKPSSGTLPGVVGEQSPSVNKEERKPVSFNVIGRTKFRRLLRKTT